jgi:hypothetical protein
MSRTTAFQRLAGAAFAGASRVESSAVGAARAGALPRWPCTAARGGPASTTAVVQARVVRQASARSFASSTHESREDGAGSPSAHRTPPAPSTLPTPAPESGEAAGVLTYVGPLATTVVRLKRLSLASCCLTTAAAPALAGLQATGAAGTPAGAAAQAGIAAAIAAFGVGTTGLVHWFTKPYVLALAARTADLKGAGDATIAVTRMDHFGRRVTTPVRLASVRPPPAGTVHPQVSFADSDDGGRLYYVDADHWPASSRASARLLEVLTPGDEEEEEAAEGVGEEQGGGGGSRRGQAPAGKREEEAAA